MKTEIPTSFLVAALCASAFAASLSLLAFPAKVATEAVAEEAIPPRDAMPSRAVRVIVASPYQFQR